MRSFILSIDCNHVVTQASVVLNPFTSPPFADDQVKEGSVSMNDIMFMFFLLFVVKVGQGIVGYTLPPWLVRSQADRLPPQERGQTSY